MYVEKHVLLPLDNDTQVAMLGHTSNSLEIAYLLILSSDMRAASNFLATQNAMRLIKLKIGCWTPKSGSGWEISYRLVRINAINRSRPC
jgi:hypothetical protein